MPRPPPQVSALLRRFVEERTGLHYGEEIQDLLLDKLSRRAALAGFESALDYYYFLRYDPAASAEMDSLIDAIVVGETYLFREPDQLRVLVDEVLAPQALGGRRLRVWSAACSTGAEPLTLAALLAQRGIDQRVEIVASDISLSALERARRGQLGRRALRDSLPPGCERWFLVEPDGSVCVSPELLERIQWRRVNLVNPLEMRAMSPCDAILCRNVLIYFSDDTARSVVEALNDVLVPGGHLLVGASESLLRLGTLLSCEERGGAFFYRKAMEAS